jgi:3',5'-cyclic AMP phosphodiesterase CpdA
MDMLTAEIAAPAIRLSEYGRPSRVLIHISDTHLVFDDNLLYGSVDSTRHLEEALHEMEASGIHPDALVFTGDLADRGEAQAYDLIRERVEPVAARMGAELIWLMGNHDSRQAFRSQLLDQPGSSAPIDFMRDLGGLRLIALDSSAPGHHYGEVTSDQLDWLRDVLTTPAPLGTVLAMHHPPIPSILDLAVAVELRDQDALADVLRGSDVRSIIAGHLHYSSSATFAGIPVSVASATCYTQDLTVPVGGTRPRDAAQAYNLIHVYDETIVHSVVPIGRGPAMSFTSAVESARLLEADGIRICD